MKHLINEGWTLVEQSLSRGVSQASAVLTDTGRRYRINLPCDVHEPLISEGFIGEPLEGINCFDSEWIEERSWWFSREIALSSTQLKCTRLDLTFESLDGEADVFFNGVHLGHHRNCHRPFTANILSHAKEGSNSVLLRLTAGAEHYSQDQTQQYADSVGKTYRRGEDRRVFLRKPQYVYGWDWGPRVATCGIVKDAYLVEFGGIAVRDCMLETVSTAGDGSPARLVATVEVENLHPYATQECEVVVRLAPPGASGANESTAVVEGLLRSGLNWFRLEIDVTDARLWWPSGMGAQPMYQVSAAVTASGITYSHPDFAYGIRTLSLNQDTTARGRRFEFEVNGKPVFCRGGNWIPADSIYSRVTDEKYTTLIQEAREANFTMLRIWGGGIYERDIFYELCDQHGILVWQDLMYACALYPDDEAWFREESRQEIDYQTRRLRNHACIAVICGNNENHWGFHDWWVGDRTPEYLGGVVVYNEIAPEIVRSNCPHIPYWNSSPYGGEDPNGNDVGDRHHWVDCTMNEDMEKRITPEEYDKVTSKFVSEYGYIGPCSLESIRRYHGDHPIDRGNEVWDWHNNEFEKDTVVAGISKHYCDADTLDLDGYLYYAGLCQAMMLGYSLEAIRAKPECAGALFWMYNDTWGEVGWTIIDYYLDRKPSFYAVKRAFAPRRVIVRREGDAVVVILCNDTAEAVEIPVQTGTVSLDGSKRKLEETTLRAAPFSRVPISFETDLSNATGADATELFVVIPSEGDQPGIEPAYLRPGVFRDLSLTDPIITIRQGAAEHASTSLIEVSCNTYAHAVHLALPKGARPSDDYFDLLPGETRLIRVDGLNPAATGNIRATGVGASRK